MSITRQFIPFVSSLSVDIYIRLKSCNRLKKVVDVSFQAFANTNNKIFGN
jgi:hypothetical protein